MNRYRLKFLFMNAFVYLEIKHDHRSDTTVHEVAEALAKKLGMEFFDLEEIE